MHPFVWTNREETLIELSLTLSALVLAIGRHAVESRGGTVKTNPPAFEMTCSGIPIAEQQSCRYEVERLFTALQHTTVFHWDALELNISLS